MDGDAVITLAAARNWRHDLTAELLRHQPIRRPPKVALRVRLADQSPKPLPNGSAEAQPSSLWGGKELVRFSVVDIRGRHGLGV